MYLHCADSYYDMNMSFMQLKCKMLKYKKPIEIQQERVTDIL